jgi:hypothetical protein
VIKSYIKIETRKSAQPGHRIELHSWTPAPIVRRALDFEMPCVACGRMNHPFRERGPGGHVYYAPTCPLTVNIGCSRGKAARDEYNRVTAAVEPRKAQKAQGDLFP